MENANPEYAVTKEEEDEYLDKIKYLGKDMSKTLERYQKKLWLKTITWYIIADNIKDKIRDFIEKKVKALDITIIILAQFHPDEFLFELYINKKTKLLHNKHRRKNIKYNRSFSFYNIYININSNYFSYFSLSYPKNIYDI